MTVAGELVVQLRGQNVGLTELLQRVETQSRTSGDSAIRLAQQYARLAAAQGQPAAGARLLAEALRNTQGVSERAAAAAQAQINTLQRGVPIVQQFGGAVSSSLLSIVGPAALVTGALTATRKAIDSFGEAFTFKTNLDANKRAIDAQLVSVRDSGPVWSEAAAFAEKYKITQADMTSTIQASISVMRLSKASTTDLLTTLSRLQVLAPEKPISEAARALRELASGDVVSIKELFNIGAKDALRMKNEIQAGGDAVQVLSKFLDGLGIGMDALAAKTTGAAGAMRDLAIAEEQMKLAQAEFAAGPGLDILKAKIEVVTGATRLLSGEVGHAGDATQAKIVATATTYDQYTAAVARTNEQIRQTPGAGVLTEWIEGLSTLTPAQFAFAQALIATGVASQQAIAQAQALTPTLEQIANVQALFTARGNETAAAIDQLAGSMQRAAASGAEGVAFVHGLSVAIIENGLSTAQAQAAVDAYTNAQLRAAEATREEEREQRRLSGAYVDSLSTAANLNTALVDQAQKTLDAAQKTDELSRFQATLAQLGGAVAGGLQTAGNAAAALASQYNIATDSALKLIQAQAALAQAKVNAAALSDQRAGERSGGSVTSFDALTKAKDIERRKAQDLAKANREATLATGTHAQKLALLRGELAKLTPGTADYIRKQTELTRLQQSAAKGGGGGGTGGGATKLTDQQKLNNALLTDQEKAHDKIEQAEKNHAKRMLDIEADFAERSLEQQRKNDAAKFDSKADFYDKLTSSTLSADIQQNLSAAYEQAFAEAQQFAQQGKQQLAADYLALKQEQIGAELDFQQKIAKAQEDGNQAEIDRLNAIENLRKQSREAKLNNLLAEGDGNVNARDQAAAEENARLAEEQGKIADSADAAAARKIAAAERSGKAVSAEKVNVDGLARSYERLNAVSGRGTTASAAASAPATPTATTSTPAPAAAAPADIVAALNGVKAAVEAVEAAVRDAGNDVESAIGRAGRFAS